MHLPMDAFFESLAEVHGSAVRRRHPLRRRLRRCARNRGDQGSRRYHHGAGRRHRRATLVCRRVPRPRATSTSCSRPRGLPSSSFDSGTPFGEPLGGGARGAARARLSEDEAMRKILVLLQRHTGVDFQHYRRGNDPPTPPPAHAAAPTAHPEGVSRVSAPQSCRARCAARRAPDPRDELFP